jgi:hypothetical protein
MKKNEVFWEKRVESGVHRAVYGLFHGLFHVLLGAGVCVLFGWAVMLLWNWLMPGITGWSTIGFWQAVGLLALCRLMFGGLGWHFMKKGPHGRHHRNAIREKWMQMSDEERQEFMKNRHCHPGFGRDFCREAKPEKQD